MKNAIAIRTFVIQAGVRRIVCLKRQKFRKKCVAGGDSVVINASKKEAL